jgi:CRP-like cAMP-binding protein
MAGLENILLQHPFFRGLEAQLGVAVSGCARNARFEAGECLFREGQAANEFFLLREGRIALEVHSPGQPPVVLLTLGAGEIAGVSWLVAPYRWAFDGRVLERVHALGIDARCLRAKCETDHDLGYELLKRFLALSVRRLHDTRLQHLDVYGQPGA